MSEDRAITTPSARNYLFWRRIHLAYLFAICFPLVFMGILLIFIAPFLSWIPGFLVLMALLLGDPIKKKTLKYAALCIDEGQCPCCKATATDGTIDHKPRCWVRFQLRGTFGKKSRWLS